MRFVPWLLLFGFFFWLQTRYYARRRRPMGWAEFSVRAVGFVGCLALAFYAFRSALLS